MTNDPRYPQQYPGAPYPQGQAYSGAGYNPAPPGGAFPDYYGFPGGRDPNAPASSGLGIASFIIGLVSGAVIAISIVVATMITLRAGGQMDAKSPEAIGLGLVIILAMGASVIGGIMAMVNLTQVNRKKLFGLFGLLINGGIVLLVVALMVIGSLKS